MTQARLKASETRRLQQNQILLCEARKTKTLSHKAAPEFKEKPPLHTLSPQLAFDVGFGGFRLHLGLFPLQRSEFPNRLGRAVGPKDVRWHRSLCDISAVLKS